jgi:hypothetical protein
MLFRAYTCLIQGKIRDQGPRSGDGGEQVILQPLIRNRKGRRATSGRSGKLGNSSKEKIYQRTHQVSCRRRQREENWRRKMRVSLRSFTPRRRLPLPSSRGRRPISRVRFPGVGGAAPAHSRPLWDLLFETDPVQQGCGEHSSVKLLVLDVGAARRWMDRDGFEFRSCRR